MPAPFLGLRPTQTAYGVSERAEGVLRQQLRGGRGRTRKDLVNPTEVVSVRWSLTRARYSQLMAFYRTATVRGSVAFEMDLVVDKAGVQRRTCYFVPGSLKLNGVNGATYRVTAQLEVYPADDNATTDNATMDAYEAANP